MHESSNDSAAEETGGYTGGYVQIRARFIVVFAAG
jgi:hypothetical protein